jgi:hypothetical protein
LKGVAVREELVDSNRVGGIRPLNRSSLEILKYLAVGALAVEAVEMVDVNKAVA